MDTAVRFSELKPLDSWDPFFFENKSLLNK